MAVSQMMASDLAQLHRGYAVAPMFSVGGDRDSDIAVFRWRWDRKGSPGVISYSLSSYSLSFVLRDMHADAWYDEEKIFSGYIASDCLRITPPGRLAWQTSGPCDFLQLLVPAAFVDRLSNGSIVEHYERVRGRPSIHDVSPIYVCDQFAAALGRELIKVASQIGRLRCEQVQSLSQTLVVRLLARYLSSSLADPAPKLSAGRLRRVCKYIDANFDRDLAVGDLAGVAALSASHFANAFRATTGTAPHRYLMKVRIERAQSLLVDEDRSVLNVALACGFKDASHFARVFRENVGMSPRQFRLAHSRCEPKNASVAGSRAVVPD